MDYPQGLTGSTICGQAPFGTAFPADTGFIFHFNFVFLFVLFLIRVRKRTKKNRACLPSTARRRQAARRGAGFSANCLRGSIGNRVPYEPVRCNSTAVLDGKTRKNPPHHRSRRCCIRRGDPWVARLVARSDETIPVSNAIRFQSTTKAGRVVPSQSELRYPRRSVGQRIRWVR